MRTLILLTTLITGLVLPTGTNAVVYHHPVQFKSELSLLSLNLLDQQGLNNSSIHIKTLEKQLGRKLRFMERVGLWIFRRKMKKAARRQFKGKSQRIPNGRALVLTHKRKANKVRYIRIGQKVAVLSKGASQKIEGKLVDIQENSVVISKKSGEIVEVPINDVFRISKKSSGAAIVRVIGAIFLIISIPFFVRGGQEKKSANQTSGCATSAAATAAAIALITFGYTLLLIGLVLLIIGIAAAQSSYDLTEGSDWELSAKKADQGS
ncbi:hypothetical protein [Flavilitoribacter nigricans]|uniref:Uncharacterized protein n=1 Tax=Flavilitoribacter nigricans (strain ATCC 23147 / DSM 23189 / NBRC 102662 / NCIMB 1420 / SS-2) TaxID=1122177 RepID=A0A2D0N1U5_FLAN2|nr:hypothetical protein [Flavilitoribacter nigricans]PHN02410.1 hypothetical protein CRP01_32015 [Flavilitoribacter nigricans DSM 23189 = NBRC 102662]